MNKVMLIVHLVTSVACKKQQPKSALNDYKIVWNNALTYKKVIKDGGKGCVPVLGNDSQPVVFNKLIWKEGAIVTLRVNQGKFA